MKKYIVYTSFVLNIVLFIVCIFLIKSCNTDPEVNTITKYIQKTDTITITNEKIVPVTKYITLKDTIFVNNTDTVSVQVPIEHKEYKDTIKTDSTETELFIKYSGFCAEIENIDLIHKYYNTNSTTIKEKRKGVSYGVQIGPYIGYGVGIKNNMLYPSWEVGVGIQFGIGYSKIIK